LRDKGKGERREITYIDDWTCQWLFLAGLRVLCRACLYLHTSMILVVYGKEQGCKDLRKSAADF